MSTIYTYKKHLISVVAVVMTLLMSACSEIDIAPSVEGQEVDVVFYPEIGGASTRAIGDASRIDELIVVALEGNGSPIITSMPWDDATQEGVKIRLLQGRTYDLLFWAQCQDNGVYTVGKTVTADYSRVEDGFVGVEKLDAFYAVKQNVTIGATAGSAITLHRPFAQLNLADKTNPAGEGKNYSTEVTVSGIATTFDPFRKTVSNPEEAVFTFNDYNNLTDTDYLTIDGDTYYYIASAYLFAPATIEVGYVLSEEGREVSSNGLTISVDKANIRINLCGEIILSEDILSEDVFDGTLNMRTPLIDSYDAATASYIIDECDDLVWMSEESNLGQLVNGNTFTITKDLNFAADKGHEINPAHLPVEAKIYGNGKTIRNAKIRGGGLFGDATGISISDLTVENIQAESEGTTTHVGSLVNTLKGSASFNNVTVQNATVTTPNGAAGGFVGYIVRSDKDNRNEALTVTFENCTMGSGTINGTQNEGLFVGLLRGYDNDERLSFTGCAVANGISGLDSYYKETNKACFVNGNFSTNDAWLGNEECYRGTVTFNGNRFVPKWDGTTKVTPLIGSDATGTYQAIYSAFDLANLQGESQGYVKFMEDVDLGGVPRDEEQSDNTLGDNWFTPIKSITTLEGNNKTIWNLYVEESSEWTGFIKAASGTSIHRNISFENATIICHFITTGGQDMGYAGILTPYVNGANSYTAENVRVNNSFVFGLGKIGGLIGFVSADTQSFKCKDCSVTNSTVKNIEGITDEEFLTILSYSITFKAHGEAGGLIGMIMGNADIDDCRTTGVTMDCYGVNNWKLNVLLASVDIPGRYVNQFIGNIRTVGGSKTTIDNCTVSGNTYLNREDNHSTSVKIIGKAYYLYYKALGSTKPVDTKGSVKVDGKEII